jgi:hypothetical protein
MRSHLLDSLDQGKDTGHYGRLVFAMVARSFHDPDELVGYLQKNRDFSEEQARVLVKKVQGTITICRARTRFTTGRSNKEFHICPDPGDPDACNVYNDLRSPDKIYENISEYDEQISSR